MANHGWTKTRKLMKPEQITALIEDLNKRLFKGNLKVEYHKSTKSEPGWGPHTWLLSYETGGLEWARRVCWLETGRHFEMRHGGGGHFAWWIDSAILNEIAVKFNGTIGDDGISDKWKGVPDKYNELSVYLDLVTAHCKPENKKLILQYEQELIPPEFRNGD